MKPIYEPKGKAKEYGDFALNIYTGCPHRCWYCFAPSVLRRDKEKFWSEIAPRQGIVEATRKQLKKEEISDQLIHLCFTCDPYPSGYDSTTTRDIIKLLKEYGNHVQILTKGNGERDFDLLDSADWYGVTIDGSRDHYVDVQLTLENAKGKGINTWVSFEPVVNAENVLRFIEYHHGLIDKAKIGKLNYFSSDIDWKEFGQRVNDMCLFYGIDYYIKESLRKEMDK